VRLKYLGDSYDIVKHSLLRWLSILGPWAAHPMFTESVSETDAAAFSQLIGVPLISTSPLSAERSQFLREAFLCSTHLFLDPDTGLRVKPTAGSNANTYVFADELVYIVGNCPERLTLVFDQCLARGQVREGLREKLEHLRKRGVHGLAYESHACFVLVSSDRELLLKARYVLESDGHLPPDRLRD